MDVMSCRELGENRRPGLWDLDFGDAKGPTQPDGSLLLQTRMSRDRFLLLHLHHRLFTTLLWEDVF